MKHAICTALLACSVAVVAEEQQQPAPAAEQTAPPAAEQADPPWLLGDGPWLPGDRLKPRPDSSAPPPDWRSVKPAPQVLSVQIAGGTCYFIRTVRPVMPEADAQRSGFIPLQAHVTGTVREPVCANAGAMVRLTPVLEWQGAEPAAQPVVPAGDKTNP